MIIETCLFETGFFVYTDKIAIISLMDLKNQTIELVCKITNSKAESAALLRALLAKS